MLYESQLLSFIEYRTPAIYHACRVVLIKLDMVQTRFLRDAGVDEMTALMEFNLAPLRTRRDIAMLGMVHRAAIGEGPPQLREVIKRRTGGFMVHDPYERCGRSPLIRRSVWGLLEIYNKLGSHAQNIATVSDFQQYLQNRVKRLILAGCSEDWATP